MSTRRMIIRYKLFSIVLLAALFAAGCVAPPDGSGPGGSSSTSTPPAATTGVMRGTATVEGLEVLILESFPVQVHAVVRGWVGDGCTTLDPVTVKREGQTFSITLTTSRPADAVCTQQLVSFEESVVLDVAGLPAGTYTVTANAASETFVLSVDNSLPATPAGGNQTSGNGTLSGIIWHDQCLPGGEGEPQPTATPAGCILTAEGTYQANGTRDAGELGIPGVEVTLARRACASAAVGATTLASTLTDADGRYTFPALDEGTYCVFVDASGAANAGVLLPGTWTFPASGVGAQTWPVNDTVVPVTADFGWDFQFK